MALLCFIGVMSLWLSCFFAFDFRFFRLYSHYFAFDFCGGCLWLSHFFAFNFRVFRLYSRNSHLIFAFFRLYLRYFAFDLAFISRYFAFDFCVFRLWLSRFFRLWLSRFRVFRLYLCFSPFCDFHWRYYASEYCVITHSFTF